MADSSEFQTGPERSRSPGGWRAICGPPSPGPRARPTRSPAGPPAGWPSPGGAAAPAEVLRLAAGTTWRWCPAAPARRSTGVPRRRRVDIMLDTGRLAGVGHRAGRRAPTAEVGAGTPLRAVQATLERTGRRLALDPPSPGATLGGVLAADEAGPLRHRHGSPCDQLVGVRYLDADGEPADAGVGARRAATRPGCSAAPRARSGCWSRRRCGCRPLPAEPDLGDPSGLDPAGGARPGAGACRRRPRPGGGRAGPAGRPVPAAPGSRRRRVAAPPIPWPAAPARPGRRRDAGGPAGGRPGRRAERADRLVAALGGRRARQPRRARRGGGATRSPRATSRCGSRRRSGTCTPPSTRCATPPAPRCRYAAPRGWAWCTPRCPGHVPPTGWRRSWPPSAGCCWPGGAGAWWSPRRRPSVAGRRRVGSSRSHRPRLRPRQAALRPAAAASPRAASPTGI